VRGDLGALEVARPRRLVEALALLAEPERPTPLAGGTDLWVALNDGKQPSRRYLDLSRLDELRDITASSAGLRLGARTTFTELRQSKTVRGRAPVLAAMAATVGAAAIQNRGTLGGSLGNASPASDPAPVLLALDARVELVRRDGRRVARRVVPLADYFTGYRTTAATPDELISAIEIPAAALTGWHYGYRKVGTRRAQAISKVVAAIGVSLDRRSGVCVGARIAWGSVAPTTIRAPHGEGALVGRRLGAQSAVEAAAALVNDDLHPIDDLRSTAFYRSAVASRLFLELVAELGGFSAAALLDP